MSSVMRAVKGVCQTAEEAGAALPAAVPAAAVTAPAVELAVAEVVEVVVLLLLVVVVAMVEGLRCVCRVEPGLGPGM